MSGPWDDYKPATTSSGPWDAYKEKEEEHPWYHNIGASMDAVSDFVYGIPKFGAQAALALTARGVGAATGDKATLNDTWKAAGDMVNEAAPSLGSQDKVDQLPGYTVPNYPLQKLGQGIDYVGDKATELTGSGDVGGGIKIAANLLPYHILPKMAMKGMDSLKYKEPSPRPGIEPTLTPTPDGPWNDYRTPEPLANQSAMPGGEGAFDNIRRQTSGTPDIVPGDITNTPMERVTDSLLNGKDQAAIVGADNTERGVSSVHDRLNAEADAMARSTEGISYEQVPPDGSIPGNSPSRGITVPRNVDARWSAPDENGIPVRQGFPEVREPVETQSIRNDTPEVNDLGNAIQEANGPKLGPDETYGSGPLDTPSPAFNGLVNTTPRRARNSQRGSVDSAFLGVDQLAKAIHATTDLVKRTAQAIGDSAKRPVKALVGMLPEDHMARVAGMKDLVYKPRPGQEYVDASLAQGKRDTSLWKNWQSGAQLAGEKVNSPALKGIGSWLNWQDKRTHLDNRLQVDPIQGQLKRVASTNPKDYETLSKVIMREQAARTLMPDAELSKALSPKAVVAYRALRRAFDDSFNKTNASRKGAGKEPITREEAYHASMRHGDFKTSLFDKNGKLIWHDASSTKAASNRFLQWAKEKMGDKVDWDKVQSWNANEVESAHIPKDVMTTYHEALKLIDPNNPLTTLISDSINKINADRGMSYAGHDQRFMEKNNIPGFEGNKPWLSDRENAHAFMNSQMRYLRESNRWNNFQEALNQMQPILTNTELIKNQPNIMQTAVAHVNRELGLTTSVFKALEKELASVVPSVAFGKNMKPIGGIGTSRSGLYNFTASLKHATYLTQLGFNPAYAITTPIQSLLAVAQHRLLTTQGHNHNVLKTLVNSITDTAAGLTRHTLSSMTGKDINTPISDFGKRALQYAEDNGILDKTVFDESGALGNDSTLRKVTRPLALTITAPEKLARYSTFMGFAHHLMDSGKLTEAEAFAKAEEFTNHSITSMRRSDRPIIVDKTGVGGQMVYTYKSFLFNEYNQLSQLGRQARKGNTTPLLAHIALLYGLGGILGLPLVGELDSGLEKLKDMYARAYPEKYGDVSGLSLKGAIMRDLPTWASLGPISGATGTNIGTRSSSQVLDLQNPLAQFAAPAQEALELGTGLGAMSHPTERRGWENAIHAQVPPGAKAAMESYLPDYKNLNPQTEDGRNPDGTQSYRKGSNVLNPDTDYKRTSRDEAIRKMGLYSEEEYKTKVIRRANQDEQSRVNTAFRSNVETGLTKALDGKEEEARNYFASALKLIPDKDKLQTAVNEAAIAHGATPEQLEVIHNQNMSNIEKIMRAK